MINKFILMLISILITGCGTKSSDQEIYEQDDLGIQITIPENWKPISSDEAGQASIVWEEDEDPPTDELCLGYFDPESGEKEGIFLLTIFGESESEQDREDLERMKGFEKINWKNRTCYYGKTVSEKHTIGEGYIIVKKGSVVSFMIGYKQSHADPVTNILNGIIF